MKARTLLLVLGLSVGVPAFAIPPVKTKVTSPLSLELFAAIDAGDAARVRHALKRGADANARLPQFYPPLQEATGRGERVSLPVVAALLEGGAKLDDETVSSALLRGNEGVFALFFQHGLDINRRVPDWSEDWDKPPVVSLFEAALQFGAAPSFLKFLLARGARPDENALRAAANSRDRTAISLLLDAGAKPRRDDLKLLCVAARVGDARLLARLLHLGISPTAPSTEDDGSPLFRACDAGEESGEEDVTRASPQSRVECARLLLDAGADVNAREGSKTPLMLAATHSRNVPLVRLLLSRGADPSARDSSGQSATFGAIPARFMTAKDAEGAFDPFDEGSEEAKRLAQAPENLETLRLLRDAGADLKSPATIPFVPLPPNWKTLRRYHVPPQSSFLTPLHLAASADRVPTLEFLLASGANLEAQEAGGKTPLHFAAGSNAPRALAALLKAKANIEARDKKGLTPLLVACGSDLEGVVSYFPLSQSVQGSMGGFEAARVLVENGADLNARTPDGLSALHWATFFGSQEIVRLLLRHDADPNAKGKNSVTPRHAASHRGAARSSRNCANAFGAWRRCESFGR